MLSAGLILSGILAIGKTPLDQPDLHSNGVNSVLFIVISKVQVSFIPRLILIDLYH